MRSQLRKRGIEWHHLRYHKRPSVPATLADTVLGALFTAFLIRRHRLDLVHARVHVPAAMALLARPLAPHDLLFDIRGLMAEEYVDAGRWRKNGIPWKLTKWVERRALKRASQCVVLTPAAKRLLFSPEDDRVTVIPCCVDFSRFSEGADRRDDVRARLGLGDAKVLAYVGKFGGWYMQREMVAFFVRARRVLTDLHFLILTQDDRELIEVELRSHGIPSTSYTITAVPPEEMGATLGGSRLGDFIHRSEAFQGRILADQVGRIPRGGSPCGYNRGRWCVGRQPRVAQGWCPGERSDPCGLGLSSGVRGGASRGSRHRAERSRTGSERALVDRRGDTAIQGRVSRYREGTRPWRPTPR